MRATRKLGGFLKPYWRWAVLAPLLMALEVAMEKARFLAAEASGPIELTKKILSEGLDEALADEQTFQGLLFTTADFQEGRAAFLEKRKPKFGG